jgi:integrase
LRSSAFIREHRDEFRDEDNGYPLSCHGLRHSYAAGKYAEFRASGESDADAKRDVSPLLGHNRPDVTRIYLAGLTDEEYRNVQ